MRRLHKVITVLAFALFLSYPLSRIQAPVAHGEFSRLVSITGGAPGKQLSKALSTAGYSGPTQLDELTICTPDANLNTMYLGHTSSVNASNGFPIAPGECVTYRAGDRPPDATRFYIFTSSTESLAVTLRER